MSDKDKKQAPHTLHDYSPPEDNQEADTILPRADSDEEQVERKAPPDQFEPLTPGGDRGSVQEVAQSIRCEIHSRQLPDI